MSLAQFIEKWTQETYPPVRVVGADLDALEARFAFVFPEDYRRAVLDQGLPQPTAALLRSIVAANLDFPDVSDFFEPGDIAQLTEDWRGGGMPSNLLAFATDCAGNLFCFKTSAGLEAADRATVWLWDHDDGGVTAVANTFALWIEQFCAVDFIEDDFQP